MGSITGGDPVDRETGNPGNDVEELVEVEEVDEPVKGRLAPSMRARMLVCGGLLFGLVTTATVLGTIYLMGPEASWEQLEPRGVALVVTGPATEVDRGLVRMLDIYGTSYQIIGPEELTRDTLYDEGGAVLFSVAVIDDNRISPDQAAFLMEAVANHSMGLVSHTSSLNFLSSALNLETLEGGELADRNYWGDFAIEDDDHHITNILYDPIDLQTHNLGGQEPIESSYFQATETVKGFNGQVLAQAMIQDYGPGYPEPSHVFPEIVTTRIGGGRVVWFARPFSAYEEASFYFVPEIKDRSLSLLVPRAVEWASGTPTATKWMYPRGRWSAYIPILDGYYITPPPGYTPVQSVNTTLVTGSGTSLIQPYTATENILISQDIPGTIGVTLRGEEEVYNLAELAPCLEHINQMLEKDFDLGLTANHHRNYHQMQPSAVITDLAQGRQDLVNLFPSTDPDLVPFLPNSGGTHGVISNSVQDSAREAGFTVCSGGMAKETPYDFYGSIYPYYEESEDPSPPMLVAEYNQFFDQITTEVDTFYYQKIHERAGCAMVALRPWAIHDSPQVQELVTGQILQAKGYGDVWFTTVPELARYWSARRDVTLETLTTATGIDLQIHNPGEATEGFTVKIHTAQLGDPAVDTGQIQAVTRGGTQIPVTGKQARDNSLFLWLDLPPNTTLTVTLAQLR